MPSERFKQEWLKKNPDLTCVQRSCHLAVDPIFTGSHQYGFTVTHNEKTFVILGSDAPTVDAIPTFAIDAIADRLQRSRHSGDPDPRDEFLIERG
jgi:hypothetical protein